MAVSFNPGMNPDAYAIQYANENNMSVDDAKAELKTKYGDPQAPTGESIMQDLVNGISNISEDSFDLSAFNIDDDDTTNPLAQLVAFIKAQIEKLTSTDETKTDDTTTKTDSTEKTSSSKKDKVNDRQTEIDDTILEYMQYHNCTAEEAKEALYGKFGNPTAPDSSSGSSSGSSSSSSSSKKPSAKRVEADNEIQNYMKHHGCSQEEAMRALQEKFGNPPER